MSKVVAGKGRDLAEGSCRSEEKRLLERLTRDTHLYVRRSPRRDIVNFIRVESGLLKTQSRLRLRSFFDDMPLTLSEKSELLELSEEGAIRRSAD